jgi:hypothetical protein
MLLACFHSGISKEGAGLWLPWWEYILRYILTSMCWYIRFPKKALNRRRACAIITSMKTRDYICDCDRGVEVITELDACGYITRVNGGELDGYHQEGFDRDVQHAGVCALAGVRPRQKRNFDVANLQNAA